MSLPGLTLSTGSEYLDSYFGGLVVYAITEAYLLRLPIITSELLSPFWSSFLEAHFRSL
jgi:hypothetical protein